MTTDRFSFLRRPALPLPIPCQFPVNHYAAIFSFVVFNT